MSGITIEVCRILIALIILIVELKVRIREKVCGSALTITMMVEVDKIRIIRGSKRIDLGLRLIPYY
jgi:hypothetical protein